MHPLQTLVSISVYRLADLAQFQDYSDSIPMFSRPIFSLSRNPSTTEVFIYFLKTSSYLLAVTVSNHSTYANVTSTYSAAGNKTNSRTKEVY